MRVAFRVDVSRQIGMGHFVRCLTLADTLKRRGAYTRFICRHLPGTLRRLLEPGRHGVVLLDAGTAAEPMDELSHSQFLGTSQRQDAAATLKALTDGSWDWLVVDHYAIDARWESMLRKAAEKTVVIDDIADRMHDCDVLLDQNLYPGMETRYHGKTPDRCQRLLGPHYALLREEFKEWRARVRPRTGPVRRVLVFLGGMDPHDLTGTTIAALHGMDSALKVDVVIGTEHPQRVQIERMCAAHSYGCHVQTSQMAALMAAADLAVGAGGSASWERCCVGLASIVLAFADNQVHIARALQDAGACLFLDRQPVTQEQIEDAVTALASDHEHLAAISRNAYTLVDGRGTERVCAAMGIA